MSESGERSRRTRLLIVEDQASELRVLLERFTDEGFTTIGCRTASEALEHIRREEIGVAIVDLNLPDLSSTQLLELLREKREKIRVIIYTGLGAFGYIEKGEDPGELIRQVHRACWSNIDRYAVELEQAIAERNQAQEALQQTLGELEYRVQERTNELDCANSALYTEIAERKQVEQALRESEERFRQLAETVNEVFWMNELQPRRIIYVNAAFERVWGYTVESLYQNPQLWGGSIHPDDHPRVQEALEQWVLGDADARLDLDYRIIRQDGEIRWIQDHGAKILDPQGRPYRFAGVAADITERKQAERVLREKEQQLLQALEHREAMSQDLHDGVLQSLYAVGLGLEIFKPLFEQNPIAALEQIDQAIAQLNSVIRDVRSFITGLDSELLQASDFTTAFQNLVSTLARTHGMQLELSIDPARVLRLTRDQASHLIYVVQEAVSNSLRHGQVRSGHISLTARGDRVCLEVSDDGVGFEIDRVEGKSLGLRNMSSRAQKLGGSVKVDSRPGRGTRISLSFPRMV